MTKLVGAFAVACLMTVLGAPNALAQVSYPATVVNVSEGDALSARLADGREVEVRLVGVDAPDPTECGGERARSVLAELVAGRAVELETDPLVEAADAEGRSRFYVDRTDGLDVGGEIVGQGWAEVPDDESFLRRNAYVDEQAGAQALGSGVWTACDGDFHRSRAEEVRALTSSAKAFVRRYYRRVSSRRFAAAWRMLGNPVKRKLGHGFGDWKRGFRGSRGVRVLAIKARLSGDRAVVRVRLRSGDRDACTGAIVRQRFTGNVLLAPRDRSWRVVKFRIRKTRGGTPRLSKSECPRPKPSPSPPPPSQDCQGYDPCLAPGPDVDCLGGSGNGPRYVDGPVSVSGGDPYDLDSDGDGVGCED